MIGLKRGTVLLCRHQPEWEAEARNTMARLRGILGDVIQDIEHVGSTAIPAIQAKPIIDIAVAVDHFRDVLVYEGALQAAGFYYRPQAGLPNQLLFGCGSFYEGTGDLQTHFIHVVHTDSPEWVNYINFRDYLNRTPSAAKAYEALKESLAKQAPVDRGRAKYLAGKHQFIVRTQRKALAASYLGKTVAIQIDRPLGSAHPEHPGLIYPVNYGYLPGVTSGDGEDLDVYLLGVDTPVQAYTARVIGMVHRRNDTEDKLIAAPMGCTFDKREIAEQVSFQEKYFDSEIEVYDAK